jgi:hypothetical protein
MAKPIPVFHGHIDESGRFGLMLQEAPARQAYFKTLAGCDVDITVRKHRNQRSLAQNAWWWGVAIPLIAEGLGYDQHEHEDVHYALVAKCFGTHHDEKLQQELPNKRSSDLTTDEFSTLMEWGVRFAATEFGIVVPLPDESEAA